MSKSSIIHDLNKLRRLIHRYAKGKPIHHKAQGTYEFHENNQNLTIEEIITNPQVLDETFSMFLQERELEKKAENFISRRYLKQWENSLLENLIRKKKEFIDGKKTQHNFSTSENEDNHSHASNKLSDAEEDDKNAKYHQININLDSGSPKKSISNYRNIKNSFNNISSSDDESIDKKDEDSSDTDEDYVSNRKNLDIDNEMEENQNEQSNDESEDMNESVSGFPIIKKNESNSSIADHTPMIPETSILSGKEIVIDFSDEMLDQ